jgi:hypothetical protein
MVRVRVRVRVWVVFWVRVRNKGLRTEGEELVLRLGVRVRVTLCCRRFSK